LKQVVSVSLGQSTRNAAWQVELEGETIAVSREGCDGDLEALKERLIALDGKVDAIGLGGCSYYLYGKNGKKTPLRAICRLAKLAKITPLCDGSVVKDTLERDVVAHMDQCGLGVAGKNVLMVCGLERLGMAEALSQAGGVMRFGDLMFALGLPGYFKKLSTIHRLLGLVAPIVSIMPFSWLYPSGGGDKRDGKWAKHYAWADVIAGDYLYIKAHMPADLYGKTILTNTVTAMDVQELRERGAHAVVTATPMMGGRSFGTNVIEALIVAASGKKDMAPDDYRAFFRRMGLEPRVEVFESAKTEG